MLSKKQDDVASAIRKNITINIDKKTAVITISTEAQDPLICKTIADSVKERLQVYITNYRTRKARVDEQYYKTLMTEAKHEYEKLAKDMVHTLMPILMCNWLVCNQSKMIWKTICS